MDADALARQTQNPVANLISVPFQNNTNFNYGPRNHTQNILNIQPVIPFGLNEDWNIITRTILPVISQPGFAPGEGTTFGLGALQVSAFLTPAQSGRLIWGVGVVGQAPTVTDEVLGSRAWGVGPTAVALTMAGQWTIGGLVNNVWSIGGEGSNKYNNFLFQPVLSYNIPQSPGTYLSFSPIITANWEARSGDQWTVPVGLSAGQVFRIGSQPVNAQIGAYYNVVRPDIGPEWQLRAQLQFLFPR
ncbi:neuromedin U [Falsiroseomonas bella]|uniref:Neuromedin U n=1 Tax=Falsiroseomonas bella TaxID=2184016 RepID=A0A317F8R4_9PROT|nr:neuromedin U [Falsiroseomonas bella]PWS34397.1 neuromedin U [Falsiroseomonas bella]